MYDIECLAYVDAYNEFNIPIIKLLRAYSRIDYQNNGYHFSDATIDQINYNYLISWGFKQKYGRWYYKNHYVEMGDLLPLSDEMKPLEPIKDMEFEVNASVKIEEKEGKLRFCLSSNIPEETPLIFTLHGKSYSAQCKINAGKTETISEWFSDKCNPINIGFYTIEITCPIFGVLPSEVKQIFGEKNRNLIGRYVKYDPICGNTICISYGIMYDGKSVNLIDMQQNIS